MIYTTKTTENTSEMPIKAKIKLLPAPAFLKEKRYEILDNGEKVKNGLCSNGCIQIPVGLAGKYYELIEIDTNEKWFNGLNQDFWEVVRTRLNFRYSKHFYDFNYERLRMCLIEPNKEHIKDINNWTEEKYFDFWDNGNVYLTATKNDDIKEKWLAPTLERFYHNVKLDF